MYLVDHTRSLDSRSRPNWRAPHSKVLEPAAAAVKKALRDRVVLVINAEADRLLGEHPDCLTSLADLRELVARLAIRRRVPLQFG